MPGLYKTKRKRLTLDSSQLNNTSIWHSTAVHEDDTTAGDGDIEIDDPDLDSMILSPSKRPALDQGTSSSTVVQTPAPTSAGRSDSESSEEEFFIGTGRNNRNDVIQDDVDPSCHQSSRFGPVIINPPSGHTYFASILHKSGFILSQPKNHLRVDAVVFRKNMQDWLNKNNDENSRIENETSKFLTATNNYFMINENLRHSFTTTLNDTEYIQPSLLHCLLGVQFLQPHLLKVILPLIAEASYSNTQEDCDLIATIMTQMKWLPTLVDGKSLASGIMDILENATAATRKQIIRLLPEVFLPEFHSELIPKLLEIFETGTQVNIAMLDCFASLEIPDAECIDIRRKAVDQMAAAPLVELPAYFAFLFRVGTVSHLEEGINEMREKIEIKSRGNDPTNVAYQCEILERIRFCISVNDTIMKLWITKIKDDLTCGLELKTLDLIMLLVFAESSDKSVMTTLRLLFDSQDLVCKLFDKLMEHNKHMVFELFPTLAEFLDSVLRTKDAKCHDAVSEITWKLFVGLGPSKSQHLTSNLIGVIINGHPNCRDVALKIFTKIAETDPLKLLFFHHYLMGALAYVIKFPPRQMQALMNLLAILANVPENAQGQTNTFTIEFMILLRKQLTHTNLQTRCFGVLGTIAAVRQLATHSPADQEKINELLQLAWSSTERDEEACSIFFDELTSSVQMLPKEVCEKFRDILKTKFETTWTMDLASESQTPGGTRGKGDLELSPTFDANKEIQRDSLLIILEPKVLEMSPLVVPSHLRVMVELEKVVEDGALEGIDVVIGCPILFPKLTKYYELESLDDFNFNQRFHLGQYLALATNYFRECVSAFVKSDNPELRLKVWLRFNNIITLQKLWVKHLHSFPNLPPAYGADKNMSPVSTSAGFSGGAFQAAQAGTSKKPKPRIVKKQGKKAKSKKNEEEEEHSKSNSEEENEGDEQDVSEVCLHINLEEMIQPKELTLYLRRLDAEVFKLIKYPLTLTQDAIDFSEIMLNISTATQSASTMGSVEQFSAETLSYFLIELKQQVADKKRKLDIVSITNFLPHLCSHVDVIAVHSKDSAHQSKIDSCLRLLIHVMTLYFDAIGLLNNRDRKAEMIETSILTLASRYKGSSQEIDEELQTQKEAIDNASKYIGGFCHFVNPSEPQTAYEHVKLLKTIHDVLPRPDAFKLVIDEVVKVYLCRPWKMPVAVINFFLTTWLTVTPQLIKTLLSLSNELIPSTARPLASQAPISIPNCSRYKSCSKLNFHTWYSAMFSSLAQHVHKLGRRRGDFEDSYQFWKDTIDLFKTLVLLSQRIQKPIILMPLMKYSRVYLEAFIQGCVCLIPEIYKSDSSAGLVFIKTLQAATRRIQNICEHSKVVKDNTLMRHVPHIKKVLETLVFRVRESLTNYGAASAFWMGSLKLKDLDGKEMSSQPFKQTELPSSESEDEDPSETRTTPSTNVLDSESVSQEMTGNTDMGNESEPNESNDDNPFGENSDSD